MWVKDEDFPGLAMSRSFGDKIASSVGVISEPEVFSIANKDEGSTIIMGSDGIWDFICNERV